ncbi:MAG: ADP-ribosylglycohydrolase family protein [Promethearchaeota archaeon]
MLKKLQNMTYNEYFGRVLGGWTGRVIGSHFGTPLEFRSYKHITKKYCDGGKRDIRYYVKKVNPDAVNDDEIYQIVALLTLKKKGVDITTKDIANSWNDLLMGKQYTAERVALKNIRKGILPPDSASEKFGNIWFDAIGAQMKADIWGLLCPACPSLAASLARIDGAVAHQGIGIDGEIFLAVLISNAFLISFGDLKPGIMGILLKESLNYLEKDSLYRKFIEFALGLYEEQKNWRTARNLLMDKWHEIRKRLKEKASFKRRVIALNKFFGNVHVLPNAGIITLSLLYGQDNFPDDPLTFFGETYSQISKESETSASMGNNPNIDPFGRPICLAGMMAADTDCNCGNIGTIMGTILGAKNIPLRWKKPLNNKFNTLVKGAQHWKIDELAKEIANMGIKIIENKCKSLKIIQN